MNIRFLSDLHWLHDNVLAFDGRPFINVHQMYEYMKEEWNDVVEDDDLTYLLGDVCWSRDPEVVANLLKPLKGRLRLITGNHDEFLRNAEIKKRFEVIRPYDEISIELAGKKHHIVLSHYPYYSWRNMQGIGKQREDAWIHLHGHVHMTKEYFNYLKSLDELNPKDYSPLKAYNVGAMCPWIYYQPKTLEEIITGFDKWYKKEKVLELANK